MSVIYQDQTTAREKIAQAREAGTLKTFRTRFPGDCGICRASLPLGTLVRSPERGAVICTPCFEGGAADEPVAEKPAAFTPTAEQVAALELFATGESLAIEAGAGTGKTSTLKLLAESTTRRGQYIAFNRAIVAESAGKFPRSVDCSTAHSLAFKAVGHTFRHRLNSGRMKSMEVANRLGVSAISVETTVGETTETRQLSRSYLGGLVLKAVRRFCQSADLEPTWRHVPRNDTLDDSANETVARALEPIVRKAWADLRDPNGGLPFSHDHYLKLWQLDDPKIAAEFILFDEAQDANPVMVAIVAAQTHAQIVWVGDSQQEIYAFTGAVNALAKVPTTHRTFLTQSFRFGPAIADIANDILARIRGAELRLTGTETIVSAVGEVDEPRAILTRTNAAALRAVFGALEDDRRPHLVGGGKEITSFARAAERLMRGERVEHPELACFDSWVEVQEYVAQDEQGEDLRLMVKLVDDFGVDRILEALSTDVAEEDADVIISTAHKSKGREWESVQIGPDFPADPAKINDAEWRLLYVACTRARRLLDITLVGVLDVSPEAV